MYTQRNPRRRGALTLIELLVVIAIIVTIAALAAAFAPSISDSTNLTRSVDQLEQWLLTARMRAKRDQLATGLRFIPNGNTPNAFSQFQYVQQPDPLAGAPGGGFIQAAGGGAVQFGNVDFSLGGIPQNQWLVQPGDFLEVRDGGVYLITAVPNGSTLAINSNAYGQALNITSPTTNYRILRQPRILIGETPLDMPNNFAVDYNPIPSGNTPAGCNVAAGPAGLPEILFAPNGAVVGTNAGNGQLLMYVHDLTQDPADTTRAFRAGIVGVQCRTGFIGAYNVAPGNDPFLFAEEGRKSGL